MKDPTFGPVYCAMYVDLATCVRSHGYALAIHGSLARDFDLICIPWVENPSEPQKVVDDLISKFAILQVGQPGKKLHGRIAYTISAAFGHCALDLSFMPVTRP